MFAYLKMCRVKGTCSLDKQISINVFISAKHNKCIKYTTICYMFPSSMTIFKH